jgi:mRNA interferase MazF
MRTRVQRWGNSLAVRIPKALAAEVGLRGDSPVELRLDGGTIVLEPRVSLPRLDDLLVGIRPGNLHRGADTGPAAGDEAL